MSEWRRAGWSTRTATGGTTTGGGGTTSGSAPSGGGIDSTGEGIYETVYGPAVDHPPGARISGLLTLAHNWAIMAPIAVAIGDTSYITGHFVYLTGVQTAKIIGARYRINGGTSATIKVQVNGVDVAGLTGLVVTTTTAQTLLATGGFPLTDGVYIAPVVTAVSGAPVNLSFALYIEYAA